MQSTRQPASSSESGYTLIELMVAVTVLMIVSATVMDGVLRMSRVSGSVSNRSEMHSGIRNATELLTQEVGQAGRVSLPAAVTLTGGTPIGVQTVGISSATGMFVGERLVIDAGPLRETVTLTAVDPIGNTITGRFRNNHAAGAPITVHGGFSDGIVPTTNANGSTATRLKLFGDINDDGNMVYVEYWCDTAGGNLYRNMMAFDAGAKPAVTVGEVLLNNILPNPAGEPCFTYQEETVSGTTFVVDVAITLTVQTAQADPITGAFQTETKALLNVSPRNVYYVWQLASGAVNNRVQPMPPTIAALLP